MGFITSSRIKRKLAISQTKSTITKYRVLRVKMLKNIIEVKPLENYKLYLRFEDNNEGVIDISKIIEFTGIFTPLKVLDYFQTVKLNPEWGTIYWDNGADLDPDVLYAAITKQNLPQFSSYVYQK